METYKQYIVSYEDGDMQQCAKLVHDFINLRTYQGVDLPVDFLSIIEGLLTALKVDGRPAPSQKEFEGICESIYHRLLVGHGRPDVNN